MGTGALKYAYWKSPIGPMFLLAGERGLCRIVIGRDLSHCLGEAAGRYGICPAAGHAELVRYTAPLNGYLRGRARRCSFALDWEVNGATPFQRRVWEALQDIPYGRVRSYGRVARDIGMSGAARAVGGANRRNPWPIVVPCHRVIASGGAIGGYSGGTEIKRALLALEGVHIT